MQVKKLKTLHQKAPVGIDVNPYFSWIMESSDEKDVMQTAYRLTIQHQDGSVVWDTGKVESDSSNYICYAGEPLESRSLYTWSVTIWDNKGGESGNESVFETAFLSKDEWKAIWAESALPRGKSKVGFGNQPPATMFRKAFQLKEGIASARLYATCHGVYRLTLNGRRPDDREFAPEFTAYEKYLCYQTYDVTRLLHSGQNALGMYVGDGWYAGRHTIQNIKNFKPVHAVLFQLEIMYLDGSSETICSDENMKTMNGPVLSSDLFAGEKYDANKEIPFWDTPDFDDASWKPVATKPYGYNNLKAQYGEPVRPAVTLSAAKIYTSAKGEKIIDFGQNLVGRVRMSINLPAGTEIVLDHFETPDIEGNYFNNVLATAGVGAGCDQRVAYISNGNAVEYEPLFAFMGFRYVRVTGLTEIRAEDFTAIALSSEKENTGTFECSNPLINRLYENTRWSQRSNMLSIPTDCPQREKAGWTGDILIYATTALLNEDATAFLTRWLQNLVCEQDKSGAVPIVVPYVKPYAKMAKLMGLMKRNKGMVASAGWADAAVIVPYSMYQVTGNTVILDEQYDSMKRWCGYIINTAKTQRGSKKIPKEIDQYLWNTGFHFGEWLVPSLTTKGFSSMSELKKGIESTLVYIAPIFGWYSVFTMAKIAGVLGKEEDERYFTEIAGKMKDAIQRGIIDEKGNMPTELMGAYALPIYFDLVPEQHKKLFADKLAKMIGDNGSCLDTGFLGTPFLLDALCKTGRLDLAYSLLYQEKCPSWLYEVKHGATTIWESWYAFKEDGTPMTVSLNHYAFGCVGDWMFRYITGIDKEQVGFKHIVINPRPDSSLTYAKRVFASQYGDIICNWERKDGKFEIEVSIPCNTTATIILPDGDEKKVGSGNYMFSCQNG